MVCCVSAGDGGGSSSQEVYSAYSELTITVKASSILIDAYIVFNGEIDESILIAGIKDYWEGDYCFPTGTKRLTVNIHCGQTSDGRAIIVSSVIGNGRSNTYSAFRGLDLSTVTIYSQYEDGRSKNIGWSMAHEFGHCLGIDDYYTHSQDSWYDPSFISIMHKVNHHAQLSDVCLAILASKTGKWQLWN